MQVQFSGFCLDNPDTRVRTLENETLIRFFPGGKVGSLYVPPCDLFINDTPRDTEAQDYTLLRRMMVRHNVEDFCSVRKFPEEIRTFIAQGMIKAVKALKPQALRRYYPLLKQSRLVEPHPYLRKMGWVHAGSTFNQE